MGILVVMSYSLLLLVSLFIQADSGEYCCPYYSSSGTYRSLSYCPKYCCGSSTNKYCCSTSYSRYYLSYSSSFWCPTATRPTTTTTVSNWGSWNGGGEYCCAYYTSSGTYSSSFHCSDYCCGTSTYKYCCSSSYSRYWASYSSSSSCSIPYWYGDGTTNVGVIVGGVIGGLLGLAAICAIITIIVCCATGKCRRNGRPANHPPPAVFNSSAAGTGNPVVYTAGPTYPGYGPGIQQPYTTYGPATQPLNTEYGPGIHAQPPATAVQSPNTGYGPGLYPPNSETWLPPNTGPGVAASDPSAPPPPYPATDTKQLPN